MKAVAPVRRTPPRPSEFSIPVTGSLHEVIDIECDACGTVKVLMPVSALALLRGSHLWCPICFAESATRVVRDIDISDLY